MAFGKHGRQDKHSSNTLCLRGTVVIFVGVCVLAVWMMNSSSPAPVERKTFSNIRKINPDPEIPEKTGDSPPEESKEKTSDGSVSFEDSPGDLPEDAIKGDDNNPQTEQKSDLDKTLDGEKQPDGDQGLHEEKKSDLDKTFDEEKQSDGEPGLHNEKKSDGDGNSDVGKSFDGDVNLKENPLDDFENNDKDVEKVIEEATDRMADGDKSQEKKDAENSFQSEKDGDKYKEEKEKNQTEQRSNEIQEAGEKKVEDNKLPETLPNAGQFELQKENTVEPKNWETQAAESKDERERQESNIVANPEEKKEEPTAGQVEDGGNKKEQSNQVVSNSYNWQLCNVTAGPDYIPCLDNVEAIKKLTSTKHFEHRERHCPQEPPKCLVPLPPGYKLPVHWPESREKVWYSNVPHTKLAEVKKHQNWMRVEGEHVIFPGGGTQFRNGALHYIDFIEETIPDVAWGKHSRVILDVGCGVASFGGFLFEKDVLTMSLAPKDEHEAQVQFALERGIPAISAVMGTKRLPFPSAAFDIVHCARCRVPWHADGGRLLLELNRLLRPGGYFVWSATPVYQNKDEDVGIWKAMSSLTASICWDLLAKKSDGINEVGVAIYRKPTSNHCYESRRNNDPPLCAEADDPYAAWYVPMESCLHRVPTDEERGTEWPEEWPQRLEKVPFWLKGDAQDRFSSETEHWKRIVSKSYLQGLGIDWSAVRNVMDMKAVYGGFAAALASQPVWVMNVVPTDAKNTLPIIYDRGLFGIHHDWCESFSTYPRSYDLLHADHLFSGLTKRCSLVAVMAEVDRILRPGGYVIFRDKVDTLNEMESMIRSLQWDIRLTYTQEKEGILCAQKTMWRP